MTPNLDEIRQRAGSAIESAQRLIGHAFGNGGERPRLSIPARPAYDDDLIVCDALGKIAPLCDEAERLKAEVAHWKANHDEMKARNDVLRDRLDLDAEKVKPRLALLDRYDALKAENAKLREVAEKARYVSWNGCGFAELDAALESLANGGAGGG